MTGRRAFLLLLMVIGVLGLVRPEDARSYVFMGQRWSSAFARMNVNTSQWSAADRSEIATACNTWTSVSGSTFRFAVQVIAWDPNVVNYWNGQNDIYVNDLGPWTLGVMYPKFNGSYFVETDIEIDTWVAAGLSEDMQAVVLHELGHALGLGHEDDVPAVMNTYGSLVRTLFADDINGIRALYPDTSVPPPPPGPDITVVEISHAPAMQLGLEVEVHWTFQNEGSVPCSAFDAVVYLDGEKAPGPATGQEMGRVSVAGIPSGQTGSGFLRVQVPDVLLPGMWYLGVRAENVNGDINGSNNAAAPPRPLEIERPSIDIGPRDRARGTLGPYGKDCYFIELPIGIKVKAKVKAKRIKGTESKRQVQAFLGIHRPGITRPFEWDWGRKATVKRLTDQEGRHEIRVANDRAVPLTYDLKLKVYDQKFSGTEAIGKSLSFHTWPGGKVKASIEADVGTILDLTLVDPDGDEVDLTGTLKIKSGGRKLKLKLKSVSKAGKYTMVIGGSRSGYVTYKLRVTTPTARVTHERDEED